jgi:hypothetical protein
VPKNDCLTAVLDEIDRVGGEAEIDAGRKHPVITWRTQEETGQIVIARSPSDRRAHHAARAHARRVLRPKRSLDEKPVARAPSAPAETSSARIVREANERKAAEREERRRRNEEAKAAKDATRAEKERLQVEERRRAMESVPPLPAPQKPKKAARRANRRNERVDPVALALAAFDESVDRYYAMLHGAATTRKGNWREFIAHGAACPDLAPDVRRWFRRCSEVQKSTFTAAILDKLNDLRAAFRVAVVEIGDEELTKLAKENDKYHFVMAHDIESALEEDKAAAKRLSIFKEPQK